MSNLKSKIEHKKTEIDLKRRNLKDNWRKGKRRFGKSLTYDISLLGGLALGYLIMPKRLGRLLIRGWSLYTTVSQLSNLFIGRRQEPDSEHHGRSEDHSRSSRRLRRVK